MAAEYKVISTQSYHYQDATSRVVDGFRVFFFLPAFNETLYVLVPNLSKDTVKKAIDEVLTERKNIATI